VREHHQLAIRDGRCDRLPVGEGAARVGEFIDAVEPDTIVTCAQDGITGPSDHRAVSAWTTEALARSRSGSLWYATLTAAFHDQ
jgi:LmbE family N-acetylglucosaminyl deacetylase